MRGNYCSILGLYRDNGKKNYYSILGFRLLGPFVAFELYKVSESSGSMQGGWWADCELSLLQRTPLNPRDALQRDPYPKP